MVGTPGKVDQRIFPLTTSPASVPPRTSGSPAGNAVVAELRRTGQQRLHDLPAARIRHVHDIDASPQLEQFDREVALGADPRGRIIQLPRPRLGLGDELDHGVGEVGQSNHQVGRSAQQRNRHEIPGRIEGHRLVEQWVHHQYARRQKERVAVGLGTRGNAHGDIAAGAAAIFHDDALPELLGQRVHDDPRQNVHRAYRCERNDHADGPGGGIALRCSGARQPVKGRHRGRGQCAATARQRFAQPDALRRASSVFCQ